MASLLEAPFAVLRAPRLHLPLPNIPRPSPFMIFALLFVSYFMVVSGVVYDIITEPPSVGTERDERTGALKPVVFLKYRVNGQYIIEGLSAGMLFAMGGAGVIWLDSSSRRQGSLNSKYLSMLAAIVCIGAAYVITISFLKIKIPGYGHV